MGRTYAGVLGTLAFATTIVRALIYSGGFGSTMATAIAHLIAFAVIGGMIGELAEWIVADSIRSSLRVETNSEPVKPTS